MKEFVIYPWEVNIMHYVGDCPMSMLIGSDFRSIQPNETLYKGVDQVLNMKFNNSTTSIHMQTDGTIIITIID